MSPQVTPTLVTEREGVAFSHLIFTKKLQWIFRELANPDIGIDALVEIVIEGVPTGDWLALQVKSGDSYFNEEVGSGFVFRGAVKNFEYWLRNQIPVCLILHSPSKNRCWWQPIEYQNIDITGKGCKTIVPKTNVLAEKSAEPIIAFVKSWQASRLKRGLPIVDELLSVATKNDGNLMKYGQERRGRDSGAPSRSLASS